MILLLTCIGVEARGFIFAAPIALAIGAKFIPLRKPRKLPGSINCFSKIEINCVSCIHRSDPE